MDVNGMCLLASPKATQASNHFCEFLPREDLYRLSTGSQVMSTPSFLNIFWSTSLSITVQ